MQPVVALAAFGYSEYLDAQVSSINSAFTYAGLTSIVYISVDGDFDQKKFKLLQEKPFSNISVTVNVGPNQGLNQNFLHLSKIINNNFEKYLCFFSDHDDIWMKEKVKVYFDIVSSSKDCELLLFSDSALFGDLISKRQNLWQTLNYSGGKLTFSSLLFKNYVQGATIAVTSNILREFIKLNNSRVMFDHQLAVIACLNFKVIPVNSTLLDYRIHSQNKIGIKTKKFTELGRLVYFMSRFVFFLGLYFKNSLGKFS